MYASACLAAAQACKHCNCPPFHNHACIYLAAARSIRMPYLFLLLASLGGRILLPWTVSVRTQPPRKLSGLEPSRGSLTRNTLNNRTGSEINHGAATPYSLTFLRTFFHRVRFFFLSSSDRDLGYEPSWNRNFSFHFGLSVFFWTWLVNFSCSTSSVAYGSGEHKHKHRIKDLIRNLERLAPSSGADTGMQQQQYVPIN
jgi:hypothetical protein